MFYNVEFKKVLEKAKGDRTVTLFANLCEIEPKYVTRLLLRTEKEPPKREILRKFADNSLGKVNYKDFLKVAGYDNVS